MRKDDSAGSFRKNLDRTDVEPPDVSTLRPGRTQLPGTNARIAAAHLPRRFLKTSFDKAKLQQAHSSGSSGILLIILEEPVGSCYVPCCWYPILVLVSTMMKLGTLTKGYGRSLQEVLEASNTRDRPELLPSRQYTAWRQEGICSDIDSTPDFSQAPPTCLVLVIYVQASATG